VPSKIPDFLICVENQKQKSEENLWFAILFSAAFAIGICGVHGGGVFKGLADWSAFGIGTGQQQDSLFRLAQLRRTTLQENDTRLVTGQGIFEAELPVFQIADHQI
jgi:hypothetical protein